jgi:hypothetical protein
VYVCVCLCVQKETVTDMSTQWEMVATYKRWSQHESLQHIDLGLPESRC